MAVKYPRAQELYGKEILKGHLEAGDPSLAWFHLDHASKAGRAGASLEIAHMFRDGVGFEISATDYLRYLKLAAKQGSKEAKRELGVD